MEPLEPVSASSSSSSASLPESVSQSLLMPRRPASLFNLQWIVMSFGCDTDALFMTAAEDCTVATSSKHGQRTGLAH